MSSRASLVFVGLLVSAASLPSSFAAANSIGTAGGINGRAATTAHPVKAEVTDKARKAAALKKKRQQQQAAAQAKAKAMEKPKKKEWYADDRDRGLDIAANYAPSTIKMVRDRAYIAKGDTVNTGGGNRGWRHYMDRYYSL